MVDATDNDNLLMSNDSGDDEDEEESESDDSLSEPEDEGSWREDYEEVDMEFDSESDIEENTTEYDGPDFLEGLPSFAESPVQSDEALGEAARTSSRAQMHVAPSTLENSLPESRNIQRRWDNGNKKRHLLPNPAKANTSSQSSSSSDISHNGKSKNPETAIKKHNFGTAKALPFVHSLAKRFYPINLDKITVGGIGVEHKPMDLQIWAENMKAKLAKDGIVSFAGVPVIWQDKETRRIGYASVIVDDFWYFPGDCVLLHPDVQKRNLSHKVNKNLQSNETLALFSKIIYIYQDEFDNPIAHVQWLEHGLAIFGALAGRSELFALMECSDVPLASIRKQIIVSVLQNERLDPTWYKGILEADLPDDQYVVRQQYNPKTGAFTNIVNMLNSRAKTTGEQTCSCCDQIAMKCLEQKTTILGNHTINGRRTVFAGICRRGVKYFVDDFVYIFKGASEIYEIGQITSIYALNKYSKNFGDKEIVESGWIKLEVDIFERYDKFHDAWFDEEMMERVHMVRDERRLYKSSKTRVISAGHIDAKCTVKHRDCFPTIEDLNLFKDGPDCFWANNQVPDDINPDGRILKKELVPLEPIKSSPQSKEELQKRLELVSEFESCVDKPRCLDMFSGIGGLSWGMEASGCMKVVSAVEASPAACKTYRAHSPNVIMHCADASLLLDRAVRRQMGENLAPLLDQDRMTVPDLPLPGEIDIIVGGPPCPGYSNANRHRKESDPTNALLVMYLAYAEYYRPSYFLLENVEGLLYHNPNGLANGTVKLILRALTGMGYQVQYALLQAAEYNVPSTRPRVFFWASLPGYPLPKFPRPDNVWKHGSSPLTNWFRERRAAPFKPCTAGDVVTDLPAFEWKNPHYIVPQTADQKAIEQMREEKYTLYDVGKERHYVGPDHQPYKEGGPFSEYQRKMRKGCGEHDLRNHVTRRPGATTVERVCNVPLEPGANHQALPSDLKPLSLSKSHDTTGKEMKQFPNKYGRLDMELPTNACMTTMEPSGHSGKILHPTQHRILSIREYARAMSFPDSFVFNFKDVRVDDAICGIGNAVPPSLSYALGLMLHDAYVGLYHEYLQQTVNANLTPSAQLGTPDQPIALEDDL